VGDKCFIHEFLTSEHVLMLVGQEPPRDAEWDAYLAELEGKDLEKTGVLVFSGGGGPTAPQRARLNKIIGDRNFRRAIVTDSRLVRAMVTGLGWFTQGVNAFHPRDWESGARHAGYPAAMLPKLRLQIRSTHEQLATPILWLDSVL
jgi:hypothetical protein